jgi:DNA-binding response OmpR family regulator
MDPAPAAAPGSLVGVTALCVDNEPEILDGLVALMSRWGVRVLTATGSGAARELAERERPTVLLADYRLADGEEDGLSLLADLCRDGAVAGALLTADHSATVAERARELGIPLLRKPIKPGALRALLGALASQRPATPER